MNRALVIINALALFACAMFAAANWSVATGWWSANPDDEYAATVKALGVVSDAQTLREAAETSASLYRHAANAVREQVLYKYALVILLGALAVINLVGWQRAHASNK